MKGVLLPKDGPTQTNLMFVYSLALFALAHEVRCSHSACQRFWALGAVVSASRLHVNSGSWTHLPLKLPPPGQTPVLRPSRPLFGWTHWDSCDPQFFSGAYKRAYKQPIESKTEISSRRKETKSRPDRVHGGQVLAAYAQLTVHRTGALHCWPQLRCEVRTRISKRNFPCRSRLSGEGRKPTLALRGGKALSGTFPPTALGSSKAAKSLHHSLKSEFAKHTRASFECTERWVGLNLPASSRSSGSGSARSASLQ